MDTMRECQNKGGDSFILNSFILGGRTRRHGNELVGLKTRWSYYAVRSGHLTREPVKYGVNIYI